MTFAFGPANKDVAGRSLEERLRLLEQQNRRLQTGFAAVGLALCAFICVGAMQPPANEVRAKRVVVVDAEGQERVVLGAEKDPQNKRETTFGLVLRDADGKRRGGWLTKDVTGVANLTLYTGAETRRLEGWTGKDSGGTWVVFDDAGKKFKQLP